LYEFDRFEFVSRPNEKKKERRGGGEGT